MHVHALRTGYVLFGISRFENKTSLYKYVFLIRLLFNLIFVSSQELVEEKVAGGIKPLLLIYDIMQFEGSSDISQYDHQRRLECVCREVESSLNHERERER